MGAEISLVWLTMSEGIEKSIAMVYVWCGAKVWLKPGYIMCERLETVELLGWKPCLVGCRSSKFSSG